MIWLIAVAVGVALVACNREDDDGVDAGPEKMDDGTTPKDRDTGKIDARAIAHDGGGADVSDITDGGNDGTAGDAGTELTPVAPTASRYVDLDARCDFPASLSFDLAGKRLFTTCGIWGAGGGEHYLFRSPELPAELEEWPLVAEGSGGPSHHMKISEGYYVVGHSGPDGFTAFNADAGTQTDQVLFDGLLDRTGAPPPYPLNNPSGMALLGGERFCVASSNLDYATFAYPLGMLTCIDYEGAGVFNHNSVEFVQTSGQNSTGIGLIDASPLGDGTQRFAVLNTNNYAPADGEDASLDIFTWPAMESVSVNLGSVTAQLSPSLAMDSGGNILLGLQTSPARIVKVDTSVPSVANEWELPGVENFISSILAYGDIAIISDFGSPDSGASMFFLNTTPGEWDSILETPLYGALGPAVHARYELEGEEDGETTWMNEVYQAVTEGTSAGVWRLDMDSIDE